MKQQQHDINFEEDSEKKLSYDREINCMTLKRKRSTNVNNLTALKYILFGKFSGSRHLK